MTYALLNDDNILLGYSSFPVEPHTHSVSQKSGLVVSTNIRCETGLEYAPEKIGYRLVDGVLEPA